MNKKQIDNLSKYCYDMSKLMVTVPVVGNVLSDKFSWNALVIGLASACGFLIMGFFLNKKEVDTGDKD